MRILDLMDRRPPHSFAQKTGSPIYFCVAENEINICFSKILRRKPLAALNIES